MSVLNVDRLKLKKVLELEPTDRISRPSTSLVVERVKSAREVIKNIKVKPKFDANQLLDEKYLIRSAGNHFYECGISFFKLHGSKERKKLYNPRLILVVNSLILLRSSISLVLPDDYHRTHLILADFTHVLGAKFYLNPALILSIAVIQFNQFLHYYDYINDSFPLYLKPFGMIAGLCSPKSIGLSHESEIVRMVRIMRIAELMSLMNKVSIIFVASCMHLVPLIFVYRWYELVLFGLPWSILYAMCIFYITTHYLWLCLYLLFLCLYIKMKLKTMNLLLLEKLVMKSRKFNEIQTLINNLDAIYSEISAYNDSYFCKLNFLIIGLECAITNLLLFQTLFGQMFWFLRVIFFYFSLMVAIFLLFCSKTNAIIFNEANRAYKTFNKLYLEYDKWSLSLSLRLKVCLKYHSIYYVVCSFAIAFHQLDLIVYRETWQKISWILLW